jgi:hypothetical protein
MTYVTVSELEFRANESRAFLIFKGRALSWANKWKNSFVFGSFLMCCDL